MGNRPHHVLKNVQALSSVHKRTWTILCPPTSKNPIPQDPRYPSIDCPIAKRGPCLYACPKTNPRPTTVRHTRSRILPCKATTTGTYKCLRVQSLPPNRRVKLWRPQNQPSPPPKLL